MAESYILVRWVSVMNDSVIASRDCTYRTALRLGMDSGAGKSYSTTSVRVGARYPSSKLAGNASGYRELVSTMSQ